MATTRESRFSLSKGRRYIVTCSKCQATKTVGGNKNSSLPPKIIIKKLVREGWEIGNRPQDDLCPDCVRKPIKSKLSLAQKAFTDMAAPIVKSGNHQIHFNELLLVANTLDPEQAKQLIQVLRQRIPQRPKKSPKAPKAAPTNDLEYERWLADTDDKWKQVNT